MKKGITVDKALIRYHVIKNSLITIAIIAFNIAFFYFSIFHISIEAITIIMLYLVLAIILTTFVVVLFPRLTFNIWKFWAFSHVENVHELKKRLILLEHITSENIFFEKIENCTENDRNYWEIRLKFVQEDVFVDDKTIPNETFIYYSKKMSIMIILLLIPLFAYGILIITMAVDAKVPILAVFGILFLIIASIGIYFLGYKRLRNREPQLILNNDGIYSNKKGFHKWEEIERCTISPGNKAMFGYTHSRGGECIDIQELNMKNNGIKLSKLLVVYRERNKLQNNRK